VLRNALLLLVLAAPFAAAHERYAETHSEVHPLASGGTLRLDVAVGDLHIVKGSDAQNLHMQYTIRASQESGLRDTKVSFRAESDGASIEVHTPFRGNTSVDIELEIPDPTALDVHLKVGDLRIEGIHGNKYLEVKVGDIEVSGSGADYRMVRAHASIGDVTVHPSSEEQTVANYRESGWLGRRLSYNGNGKYDLRAQVSVGDIEVH